MRIDRDQVTAFILGEKLPEEVVAEIMRSLDDPNSMARHVAREFSDLTRLALSPDGPMPGDIQRKEK